MKYLIYFAFLGIILASCSTTRLFPSEDSFVEIVDDVSLYPIGQVDPEPSKVLFKGSIVKYGNRSGLPVVYTSDTDGPYKVKRRLKYRKRSSSPSNSKSSSSNLYTTTGSSRNASSADLSYMIYSTPFDPSKNYIRGPRGGCYYLSSSGGKVYVDRDYCGEDSESKPVYQARSSSSPSYRSPSYSSSKSSSTGGTIHVKGHYRTSKSGKTTYVKPHTRRRN